MRAKVAETAIVKVLAAAPDEKVKLLLRLSDLFLTEAEKEFVSELGGTLIVDSARLVAVQIPSRHLVTLAVHLPSVIGIE